MKKLILLIFILSSHWSWAQAVNRYMVFFTDKEGSIYSTANPEEFLTARSIERRKKSGINITLRDLPVNEVYVDQVKASGVAVFYRSRWLNAVLVEDEPEKVESLKALPFVDEIKYVAPGQRLNARIQRPGLVGTAINPIPNTQNELLQVPLMHEQGYLGQDVLIAVLDNGFLGVDKINKFDHLFRDDQLLEYWDFVRYSPDVFLAGDHGTRALSTIAVIDSGTFVGTAPRASFLLAITEDTGDAATPNSEYIIEEYNWLIASEWADSLGADIITSSLGYTTFDDPSMDYTFSQMDGQTAVATRAAVWAAERGILVVTSSGNSRNGPWRYIGTPADADNILTVGAVNAQGLLASFSSGGPTADGRIKPEVVAQGVSTVVVGASGEYLQNNGTSFSAPQIAGFAAGVWQAYPELTNLELRQAIMSSGSQASTPDNDYGWGIPAFGRLQQLVLSAGNGVQKGEIQLYPNPVQQPFLLLQFSQALLKPQVLKVVLIDASGRMLQQQVFSQSHNNRYEIDVAQLQAGLYYLQVISEQGSSVLKFMRQ